MREEIMEATKAITYNPETGEIIRIDRKNSNGSIDAYGYLIIKIKGNQWKAHRLAWAKHYKTPPQKNIDHINGIKTDNRISNLRDVEQRINILNTNRKINPDTGVRGVHEDKSTKGLIAIYTTRINKKTYRFRSIQEAQKIRKQWGLS